MTKLWIGLVGLVVLGPLAGASAGPFDTYAAASTLVAKNAGQQPILDQGGVVCNKSSAAPSLGGGCVLFGAWDSIKVTDASAVNAVAFQVCIDNNGDGFCGGGAQQDRCFDDLFFSHNDQGVVFNPLGPLPTGFRFGCPGGAWRGYVVLLCEGVHNAGGAHVHVATTGSITGTVGGTGFGDFCNPHANGPSKPYRVL